MNISEGRFNYTVGIMTVSALIWDMNFSMTYQMVSHFIYNGCCRFSMMCFISFHFNLIYYAVLTIYNNNTMNKEKLSAQTTTAMDNTSSGDKPVQIICGPLLRYMEIDYDTRIWRGSCLIVINSSKAPTLTLLLQSDVTNKKQLIKPTQVETIDIFRDEYYFWRYELLIPLINEPQTVSYTSNYFPRDQQQYQFHVPAIQDSMRFMFYSCSGFSNIPQEIKDRFGEKTAPLWQDVLDRHQVMAYHVMIGGGDQLYQDTLIYDDFMKPWVNEKDPKKRLAMILPQSMRDGFEHFYFWNYIKNFG